MRRGPGEHLDVAALVGPLPDSASTADPDERAAAAGAGAGVGGCVVVGLAGVALLVPALVVAVLDVRLVWVVVAVWGVIALLVVRSARRERTRTIARRRRLIRFARDNGLTYAAEVPAPTSPGTVFGVGINRVTRDRVTLVEPRSITLGTHTCTAGYRHAEPRAWGFALTPLAAAVALPHLALVARAPGRRHAALPITPATPVEIAVSGPGAEAFVVHGPAGRRDGVQALLARTLFRPAVLALLTQRPVDLEVVAGHLVVYTAETVGTDPDTWRWIRDLVTTAAGALEEPVSRTPETAD